MEHVEHRHRSGCVASCPRHLDGAGQYAWPRYRRSHYIQTVQGNAGAALLRPAMGCIDTLGRPRQPQPPAPSDTQPPPCRPNLGRQAALRPRSTNPLLSPRPLPRRGSCRTHLVLLVCLEVQLVDHALHTRHGGLWVPGLGHEAGHSVGVGALQVRAPLKVAGAALRRGWGSGASRAARGRVVGVLGAAPQMCTAGGWGRR